MKKFMLFSNIYMFMLTICLSFLMFVTNNILIQWMLLEISTIIMIYLMNYNLNKMPSILYYSLSTLTSMIMILLLMMNLCQIYSMFNYNYYLNIIFQIIMMMKMGMFPFSYWMIYIYNYIMWEDIFIMSTVMKFMPMYFMINFIQLNQSMILLLMLNSIMISIFANNFKSLKKIIACSSINQTSFIIMLLYLNKSIFMYYIIFYSFMFYFLCLLMNKFNLNKKMDLIMFNNYKNINILTMMFLIYSMLPPFMSFIMKWMFMFELTNLFIYSSWFFMIMMMSSIIMIWNYLMILENSLPNFKYYYNLYIKQIKIKYMYMYMFISMNMTMFMMFYIY